MAEEVPIGCADRLAFIERRADELDLTFHNGNRKDLLAALEELPPRVAFAVLATIMADSPEGVSIKRFLQETA